MKVLIPIIIFTTIISFLYVGLEDKFIYGNHIKHIILHEKLRNYNRIYDRDKYNISLFGRDNKIYFAKSFKPKTSSLHEVQLLYIDKKGQKIKKLISAKKMLYIAQKDRWLAENVIIRRWESNNFNTEEKKEILLNLKEKSFHFKDKIYDTEHLSSKQLKDLAEKAKIIGGKYEKLYTEYHFKIAIHFMPLIILFIGIPLSTYSKRSNIIISLFYVLLVTGFFFVIFYIGSSLGNLGLIPPWLGGWLGNITFTLISLYLFRKLSL